MALASKRNIPTTRKRTKGSAIRSPNHKRQALHVSISTWLHRLTAQAKKVFSNIQYLESCTEKDCRKKVSHMSHSPVIAIAVAYLIWGMAAPITKLALTEIGPMSLLFLRMVMASLLLFPFVLRKHIAFTFHEQLYIALSGFFAIFLHIFLIYVALPLIPSIHVPIINAISPFLLIFLARLFLGERVPDRKYLGVFFGLVGVLCITVLPSVFRSQGEVLGATMTSLSHLKELYMSGQLLNPENSLWVGNLIVVLAVLLGSIGTLFIRPVKHIPGFIIAFWQCALAACFALPFALTETMHASTPQIGMYGWVGIIYNGALSSVVAYSLYNTAIQKVNVADIGIFSYLAPIGALLLGVPLLNEYPDLWFIIGSGLVLIGIWVGERKLRRRSSRIK